MLRWLAIAAVLCACGGSPCDHASLSGVCTNPNGQCVEFSGLTTQDEASSQSFCVEHQGQWGTALCPTANRLGTCQLTGAQATAVNCSPSAVVNIRYFSPFDAADAQRLCLGVPGVWTPH
jgi:hypothetical protein